MRKLAKKTDFGRLAGPSLLRLVDEAFNLSKRSVSLNGKLSSEIWDYLEQALEVYIGFNSLFSSCVFAKDNYKFFLHHREDLLSLESSKRSPVT